MGGTSLRRRPFFAHSPGGATVAPILFTANGISAAAQGNHLAAVSALGGFVCGRIRQNLEIVFVGPVIHVHLSFEFLATLRAVLPVARMFLVEVETAEREAV